jgi:hypothetical protein
VIPVSGPGGLAAQLARHAGWLLHVQISGHSPKSWLVALAAGAACVPFGLPPLLTVHSGLAPSYLASGREARLLAAMVCRLYGRAARALASAKLSLPARRPATAAGRYRTLT